uniref:Uncharacterized protein n=1 Tax=Heterorhabditis bacteriophora TaxID=37862 RepID=A0A1I7WAE5_HETBA
MISKLVPDSLSTFEVSHLIYVLIIKNIYH